MEKDNEPRYSIYNQTGLSIRVSYYLKNGSD